MKENRLPDYLNHMQEAASEACLFVQGMSQAEFQQDRRTPNCRGTTCVACATASPMVISISIWK